MPKTPTAKNIENRVRILSYNILADQLLFSHLYLYQNFANAKKPSSLQPYYLQWEYRKELLLEQLLGPQTTKTQRSPHLFSRLHYEDDQLLRPDVICLQEVDHFEELADLLSSRYQSFWISRGGAKTDGCAIFYCSSKFTLIEKHEVHYNRQDHSDGLLSARLDVTDPLFAVLAQQYPKKVLRYPYDETNQCPGEFYLPEGESNGSTNLDRDNVGLIVLLKVQSAQPKYLCVGNTHLLFNPKRMDVRLQQIDLLLHEMKALVARHNLPSDQVGLIVCGDFNSTPQSRVYEYMSKGEIKVDLQQNPLWRIDLADMEANFAFPSAYINSLEEMNVEDASDGVYVLPTQALNEFQLNHDLALSSACLHHKQEPVFTTMHRKAHKTVDYIWYTRNTMKLIKSAPVSHLPPAVLQGTTLPNKFHPSDHMMLCTELEFK